MEKELSIREKIGIVTRVYSAVENHFGHWESIPRHNLDECYQELLSSIIKDPPRREFCLALMKFLAGLENGHTWLTDPCLTVNLPENPGFEFECIDEGWFVSRSCLPGCEPGDRVTSLDNAPFEDFYLGLREYIGLKRAFFPDGGVFEGVGINPHIEVRKTSSSLRSTDDPVLAKAVETAIEQNRA